jgi:hypothetical protein
MIAKMLTAVFFGTLLAVGAPVSKVEAKPAAACANISRAACTLKGTYAYTVDGVTYALSGNLTIKQASKALKVNGFLRYVQKGGTAPAAGTTVSLSVVYMTNRVGCVAGEGGVTRQLLDAPNVPLKVEDTPLDIDTLANEYSFKMQPRKATKTVASTIAADVKSAGLKVGEIVLLLDGGRSCAVLATRK